MMPAHAESSLDAVGGHVLFLLGEVRSVVVAGGRGAGTRLGAKREERQVVWLTGKARAETAAGRTTLEPGTVWVPGPGAVRIYPVGGEAASGVELRHTGKLAVDYARFIAERFGSCVQVEPDSAALRAVKALARVEGDSREEMSASLFEWFASLHAELENRRLHLDDVVAGRLEALEHEAARHGYTVKGLARRFGCTPIYLAGRLRRRWRRSASEVLKEWRARHMALLVGQSGVTLAEAAKQSGYSSVSCFNCAFKRSHGVPPGMARREGALVAAVSRVPAPAEEAAEPFVGQDILPVAVWGGPYFQFDGGEISEGYTEPFDMAMNALTDSVHWVYTLEGEALFEAGGESLKVEPGMFVVYPQPLNGCWRTPEGKRWRRVWIKARGEWAAGAILGMAGATGWAGRLASDAAPVVMARRWVRFWNSHRREPSLAASRRAHTWLLAWWRSLRANAVSFVPMSDLRRFHSRSFFGRIKTIGAYAEEIGYSRSYISRRLGKQWLGGTPAQIVRRQRLAQAALALKQTNAPVAKIAQDACFASASTFIPAFRREFGCTPLVYRFKNR